MPSIEQWFYCPRLLLLSLFRSWIRQNEKFTFTKDTLILGILGELFEIKGLLFHYRGGQWFGCFPPITGERHEK